jgi:hypothetical protein
VLREALGGSVVEGREYRLFRRTPTNDPRKLFWGQGEADFIKNNQLSTRGTGEGVRGKIAFGAIFNPCRRECVLRLRMVTLFAIPAYPWLVYRGVRLAVRTFEATVGGAGANIKKIGDVINGVPATG